MLDGAEIQDVGMMSVGSTLNRRADNPCNCSPAKVSLIAIVVLSLVATYIANLWTLEVDFNKRHSGSRSSPIEGAEGPGRLKIKVHIKTAIGSDDVIAPADKAQSPPSNTLVNLFSENDGRLNQEATPPDGGKERNESRVSKHELLRLIPDVTSPYVNCARIFANDIKELRKAGVYKLSHPFIPVSDQQYVQLASDCGTFRADRKYFSSPVSQEEEKFPIAYSIVMYRDVEQFERLLRAIYRPQNYYCIHVDLKSSTSTHNAVRAIAKCFDNVFLSSREVPVGWGSFMVVEPELICMRDLWRHKSWRYFINLTGQEFPLKTNLDIVRILKAFNGSNNIEGTVKRRNQERTKYIHQGFEKTSFEKEPPPVDITLTKGSVHVAATRGFVDAVLHDKDVIAFINWVKDTGVPDETVFSALNHSPQLGIPGTYKGNPETDNDKYPFFTRFKNWGSWPFDWPCHGKRSGLICILSAGDLPLLATRPELFANKFHLDYDPVALTCMEQLHYNRTRQDIMGTRLLELTVYRKADFTWNHV